MTGAPPAPPAPPQRSTSRNTDPKPPPNQARQHPTARHPHSHTYRVQPASFLAGGGPSSASWGGRPCAGPASCPAGGVQLHTDTSVTRPCVTQPHRAAQALAAAHRTLQKSRCLRLVSVSVSTLTPSAKTVHWNVLARLQLRTLRAFPAAGPAAVCRLKGRRTL